MANYPSQGTTLPSTLDSIPAPSGASNLIDTDYVIGQDNIKGKYLFNLDSHGKVFSISALTIVLFVVLDLQSEVEPLFTAIRGWLTNHLAWFFLGLPFTIVLLVGCVAVVEGLLSEPR